MSYPKNEEIALTYEEIKILKRHSFFNNPDMLTMVSRKKRNIVITFFVLFVLIDSLLCKWIGINIYIPVRLGRVLDKLLILIFAIYVIKLDREIKILLGLLHRISCKIDFLHPAK